MALHLLLTSGLLNFFWEGSKVERRKKKSKQTDFRVIGLVSQVGVELCVHTMLESFQMHVACQYLLSYD